MGKNDTSYVTWCDECGEFTLHIQVKADVKIKGQTLNGATTIQCSKAYEHKDKPRKAA